MTGHVTGCGRDEEHCGTPDVGGFAESALGDPREVHVLPVPSSANTASVELCSNVTGCNAVNSDPSPRPL